MNSEYYATIEWRRGDEPFDPASYSRAHSWSFDGGAVVPASASPHVVPEPQSVAANVDPEEAFVASLSSCHMLFFLSIAAKKRLVIDAYVDAAVGVMALNAAGKMAMARVTLRPTVSFSGEGRPSRVEIEKIHAAAHEHCFIANSVTTDVVIEVRE